MNESFALEDAMINDELLFYRLSCFFNKFCYWQYLFTFVGFQRKGVEENE
jgi:hypothetical protein